MKWFDSILKWWMKSFAWWKPHFTSHLAFPREMADISVLAKQRRAAAAGTAPRWEPLGLEPRNHQKLGHTVDGRNPAPVDRRFIPLLKGVWTMVVQDFWKIHNMIDTSWESAANNLIISCFFAKKPWFWGVSGKMLKKNLYPHGGHLFSDMWIDDEPVDFEV